MRRRKKSYISRVELESDEDGRRAFYLAWESIGASTWGKTSEKALGTIREVRSMIIEELAEESKGLPTMEEMGVYDDALVAVNL